MSNANELTQTSSGKRKREPPPQAIQWIPWEKILIWGLFLSLVFVMRHFFLIIFLTFITSYMMRNVVVRLAGVLLPGRSNIWLERGLTVVCFLLLLFGLYQAGRFFGPRLIAQAQALAGRATQMDPKKEFENALGKAVGPFLFRKSYGDRGDPRYQKQFELFKAEGSPRFVDYQDFAALEASIEGSLELDMENEERQRLLADVARRNGDPGKDFDDWYLKNQAHAAVDRNREGAIARWETRQQTSRPDQFEQLRKRSDYLAVREEGMKRDALEQVRRDQRRFAELVDEWKMQTVAHRVAERKQAPAYVDRLKTYYEQRKQQAPTIVKFEFDKYRQLQQAFKQGEGAFTAALGKLDNPGDSNSEEIAHRDFAAKEQVSLAINWWQSDQTALAIKSAVGKSIADLAGAAANWVKDAIRYTITLPVQIGLSLLLSFFITIDIPTMKKGVARLKTSRAAGLYEEIAPGLSSFAWLMGRAFQAQAMIAVCNTVLTFIAIRLIGIENEVFLCAIVFICSFIPVVGVVMSSAPIAVMAIIQQPNGSIWLALLAIGAILVIHFVETSVFNPKILGDMLHLHPVLVLTILAVGEHFFGVWGLLLGTPVVVYIIRFIILDEGIPGVIEPIRRTAPQPSPG